MSLNNFSNLAERSTAVCFEPITILDHAEDVAGGLRLDTSSLQYRQ